MKIKKNNLLIVFILFCAVLMSGTKMAYADDTMGVTVIPIIPENQIDKNLTYYKIKVAPNMEQDLKMELKNSRDKEVTVNLQVNQGATASTGSIDYTKIQKRKEKDTSLFMHIEDILTYDKKVVIPAKGEKTVNFHLKIPEKAFDGIVIAGINIKEDTTENDNKEVKNNKNAMQIKNEIMQVIGITLSETDNKVEADLDLKKIKPAQNAGRNVALINIQNSKAAVLEDIVYEAKIYRKGTKNILHETLVKGYRFAPNSNFNLPVSWEAQPFEPGSYTAKVKAESIATEQKWEWEKDFEITAQEAKELNEKAVDVEGNNLMFYIIAGIIGVVVLIVLIIMIVLVRKRNQAFH